MIRLTFQNTSIKSFEIPEVLVKNVSAAWNQIREWRNTIPFDALEGAILEVYEGDNLIKSDRIPAEIIFKANKNGKLVFKDYSKIKARKAVNSLVEPWQTRAVASVKGLNNFALVTTRGKVDMGKIFNPIF